MSILAITGVIVSAAAMIIVLSGFSGLKNYSLEFISSVSPELKITPDKGKSFEFTNEMKSFLEDRKIKYYNSFDDKALISINDNNRIMIIRGLDGRFPKSNIDSIIYQGAWFESNSNEIVLGWSSAYDLGISIQDALNPINLYVPKPGKGQVFSEKDILKSEKVLASGVFSINEELNNSVVFTNMIVARELFGLNKKEVGAINIVNTETSKGFEKIVSAFFGSNFSVANRVQQNSTLYKMLNTEQIAIYLIFSLIVIVALFNMFGALMMMVIEKRKNLQTLMVMGLTKKEVGKIFFYQGLLISFVGCVIGLLAGSILIFAQQKLSLFMITESLAYPVVFETTNFLMVFLTVILLGLVVSAIISFYVKKSIPQISQQ
tara:strand:+ start:162 stop:1289 length:1128 start_codon:yes stop_codon:yes gene_type:complete